MQERQRCLLLRSLALKQVDVQVASRLTGQSDEEAAHLLIDKQVSGKEIESIQRRGGPYDIGTRRSTAAIIHLKKILPNR